jgi:hypothetical protein
MWLFDAAIQHFYENVCIFCEFDHQFLSLLHSFKAGFVYAVRVMEKQVVLARQLHFDVLWACFASLQFLIKFFLFTSTKIFTLMASNVPTS